MSTLAQSLAANMDGYVPVEKPSFEGGAPPPDAQPSYNVMMRCPLPPTSADADSLRQFYRGNQVPQMRLLPPPTATSTSGGTVIENVSANVTTSTSISTGGSSTIAAKTAVVTTAVLNPNQRFTGAFTISRSFQLLAVNATGACRIRIYGTAAAQSQDLGRALDFPPAPGTIQNLISDVVFDTAPYQWFYQNRIGANADNPQRQTIYVTITQLASASSTITVSLTYAPLET